MGTASQPHFLGLPREIRDIIYVYVVRNESPSGEVIVRRPLGLLDHLKHREKCATHSLLFVNRQIYDEYLEEVILYLRFRLDLNSSGSFESWRLDERIRRKISQVTLTAYPDRYKAVFPNILVRAAKVLEEIFPLLETVHLDLLVDRDALPMSDRGIQKFLDEVKSGQIESRLSWLMVDQDVASVEGLLEPGGKLVRVSIVDRRLKLEGEPDAA